MYVFRQADIDIIAINWSTTQLKPEENFKKVSRGQFKFLKEEGNTDTISKDSVIGVFVKSVTYIYIKNI